MDVEASRSTRDRGASGSGAADRDTSTGRPPAPRLRPAGPGPQDRRAPAVALGLALAAAACGGGGAPGAEEPAPPGLTYGIPDPNPARYVFGDTATFEVQTGGMGTMEVSTAHEGTAEVLFRPADEGFAVTVRVPRFRGSFINPIQDPVRVTEEDIGGALGLSVDDRGAVAVTDTPSMSRELLDIVGPESLARPLFVRLPGRAVQPGDRWVDTVTTREEGTGTTSEGRSIITSTLVGDTVVAGRRLLRIDTRADNELTIEGVSGGVRIAQTLSGSTTGTVLWSADAALLVERSEQGTLEGTLEMPGVGAPPMDVRATVRRSVVLRP